ncbi:transposase [Streptomyces sp. NPDC020330]|uniref:transposase n=1 Tax=unclassified Streptomyces TaxID=2593676 RepID=UPI00378EB134
MYWYFTWWHDDGTVERIHDALRNQVRQADGRNAEPSAGLIDSQSVRTADTVLASTRSFDADKMVKGRKRFIVTDTLGLLLAVHVVAANIQDRDGARRPLLWTRLDHPSTRGSGLIRASPAAWSTGPRRSSAATWKWSARTPASRASRSSRSGGP